MKKIFGSALFLGLALGLSTVTFAQDNNSQDSESNGQAKMDRRNRKGKTGQGRNRMMGGLNRLNLTEAQREQLRALRTNNNSNAATQQEMRQLKQAKRDGTLTADQETRFKTLRQQAKADNDRRQQQISAILTPEQRQQLEQNKAERKGQMKERRQNRVTQSAPQNN